MEHSLSTNTNIFETIIQKFGYDTFLDILDTDDDLFDRHNYVHERITTTDTAIDELGFYTVTAVDDIFIEGWKNEMLYTLEQS